MKAVAYSSRTTQLRGIAILAVILIHILASIPGYIFTRPGENIIWIAIDQVARFSVPLFVALCGYGLYAKYAEQFSIRLFLTRRVWKLIPLYALWTLGLWLIFKMIPVWNTGSATYPLWRVFLFGSDYHLYFIPLIFQLYLIFPVLRHFFKKNARYTVIGTMALQWISYLFFNWYRSVDPSAALSTNQSQYILCISWIGYFSIGMLLAKQRILLSWKQNLLLILTWMTSLIAVISMAVHDIKLGLDPLYALTFTRPEVIIYAILSSILALTIQLPQQHLIKKFKKLVHTAGRYSFILYVSHTIALRFLFAHSGSFITTVQLGSAAVVTTALLIMSVYIEGSSRER